MPLRSLVTVAVCSLALAACEEEDNETFVPMPAVHAINGALTTSLKAAVGPLTIYHPKSAHPAVTALQTLADAQLYNGRSPAELWRIKPGETIKLHVDSALPQDTNFHFHGFHVSPGDNHDNVFLNIPPGGSQDY